MENTTYKEKILNILSGAALPLDVENVRVKAGIKNWQTAHKHLLQLVIENKISGQKTSHGWIFWKKCIVDERINLTKVRKEVAQNERSFNS